MCKQRLGFLVALLLTTLTVLPHDSNCFAGIRGPGKYAGTVVFDRWDGCMLYSGIYVMYVSEKVKQELRPSAGKSIQIDASDVFQPRNPGDGLIRALKILGPAPKVSNYIELSGLSLRSKVYAGNGGKPVASILLSNDGEKSVEVFSAELALTLLTRGRADESTPYDGPSYALITRQSFRLGGEEPRWQGHHWSIGKKNALPHTFTLEPNQRKTLEITFDLPDGEYDFLSGYSGHGEQGLASNLCAFDVKDGSFVSVNERGPSPLNSRVSSWPASDRIVQGRWLIDDQGLQQGAHVMAAVVELKNHSAHELNLVFDPKNLKVELFRGDGSLVEQSAEIRSGPIPMSHRMTVSAGASCSIPTHRGGVGLPVGKTLLAVGWQTWVLPPGRYSMKGSVTIDHGYGEASLDPLLPTRQSAKEEVPDVGKTKSTNVALPQADFIVPELR